MGSHLVDAGSAEEIARLGLETLERQLATGDAIDGKAWQALAAASVVIGLGAIGAVDDALLAVAAAAYALVAACALMAVRPRGYQVAPPPQDVWGHYWHRPAVELHHMLADTVATAYPANAQLLRDKRRWLVGALLALAAETIVLALAAIV